MTQQGGLILVYLLALGTVVGGEEGVLMGSMPQQHQLNQYAGQEPA